MDSTYLPNLFLDEETSDVNLIVKTAGGDPETVLPAHKLVLELASNVFRSMVMTGDSNRQTGRVNLSLIVKGNMDEAIFFLRYLYTRELRRVDLSTYISLLQTAHLYAVDDLVQLCNKRIVGQVTPLNVCRTYTCLRKVASEKLSNHCLDIMLRFAFLIFKKDLHLTLEEESMIFLLASDKLNLLDEQQALSALWRWWRVRYPLSNQVNMFKEDLTKLLPLVRRRFVTNVDPGSPWYELWACLLSYSDNNLLYLSSGKCNSLRQPDVNTSSRFAEVACISRVAHEAERTTAKAFYNRLLTFSLDRDILLAGFSVQITVCEQSLHKYVFHLFINNTNISKTISSTQFLEYEYPSQKLSDTFSAGPSNQSDDTIVSQLFYVYDLSISLHTPVVLKKTELNSVDLIIDSMPKSGVYLTSYAISRNNNPPCFNDNLHFHMLSSKSAVSKLYYYI